MTATTMSGPRGSIVFSAMQDAPRPVAKDYIEFAAMGSTPRWSRDFTTRFLRHARMEVPDEVTDTTLLLVSELVTNALQAARRLGHPSTVGLSLRLFHDHLVIEVVDSSPAVPVLIESADVLSEQGRGLHLVDALTDGLWGWFRWASSSGRKIVWCRVVV
jgi:anti-sigma regulatory factor (Ser/Thr protein kinase)